MRALRCSLRAAGVVGLAVVAACGGSDADLREVAAELEPPQAWAELEQDQVDEPLCFGSGCSTIVRAWGVDEPPAADQLRSLMEAAGWSEIEIDDCEPRANVTGPFPFCRASATSDGADIDLTAAGPISGSSHTFRITLRVSD